MNARKRIVHGDVHHCSGSHALERQKTVVGLRDCQNPFVPRDTTSAGWRSSGGNAMAQALRQKARAVASTFIGISPLVLSIEGLRQSSETPSAGLLLIL
jgi:hypothetical protein